MRSTIASFIADELLTGKGIDKVGPDESLIDSGVLDSLALVRLISFLEERFGVTVRDDEVIPENFQTIQAIEAYIGGKRDTASA